MSENFNGTFMEGVAKILDFGGNFQTMQDFDSLANNSSLLDQQFDWFSANGYVANFSTQQTVATDKSLWINPLSSSYSDASPVTTGGDLESASATDPVDESGLMIGELAAEYVVKNDAALVSVEQGKYANFSEARAFGTYMLDQGRQDVNVFEVKQQIEGAQGGKAPYVYFNDGHGAAQSSADLQQAKAYQSDSASFAQNATSYFASISWNTAAGQADLAVLQAAEAAGNGPVNGVVGIDWTHLTAFYAFSDATGSNLASTTAVTQNTGVYRQYTTVYGSPTSETSTITDQNGTVLGTITMDTSSGTPNYTVSENNATITQPPEAGEKVIGVNDTITFINETGAVEGNNDTIHAAYGDPSSQSIRVQGNANTLIADGATPWTGTVYDLNGVSNTIVDQGAGSLWISGVSTSTTIFGGSNTLTYNDGSGTIVLGSGASSINGTSGILSVFGGTGSIGYAGGTGYGNVIGGGSSNDYITGANQGGWYEGGSGGMSFIKAADTGAGTVLQGGGAGDTLEGGTRGGDYFLGGVGNETMIGNNASGTQVFYTGSNAANTDTITIGSSESIINVAAAALQLQGSGFASVFLSPGGSANLFDASGGSIDIVGFRNTVDHIEGSGGTVAYVGNDTLVKVANGASYDLINVHASNPFGA